MIILSPSNAWNKVKTFSEKGMINADWLMYALCAWGVVHLNQGDVVSA
jgi:hypothetical protein